MKYRVAFLPGVREHDIPRAPREYQEALVLGLRDLANGGLRGLPLRSGEIASQGYRKYYVSPPEVQQKMQENLRQGRRADAGTSGGYRLVYRESTVRGEPTLLVAAFGPRANSEVYHTAEQRIVEHKMAQDRSHEATRSAAPKRPLPRTPGVTSPKAPTPSAAPRAQRRPQL